MQYQEQRLAVLRRLEDVNKLILTAPMRLVDLQVQRASLQKALRRLDWKIAAAKHQPNLTREVTQ